jgi:uncharacterized protein (TIGR02147 family)
MEGLDVFSYLDYREFCRAFYSDQKIRDEKFSFRAFGKRARVAPAYLKHIIDGKRNLSPQMSLQFAYGMGLSTRETEYFELLVRFNQAPSLEEKNLFLERLRKKRAKGLKDLSLAEAALLLSHWYVVAIKELVVSLNSEDSTQIQKMLRRRLSESQIQKTISDLVQYGWLEHEEGRWRSKANQIRFPDEVKSYVVRSFHQQMLDLAKEALDDSLDRREFGSAVFSFPRQKLPALKEKIKQLQNELVIYVQEETKEMPAEERELLGFSLQLFSFLGESHEK